MRIEGSESRKGMSSGRNIMKGWMNRAMGVVLGLTVLVVGGCEEQNLTVPSASAVEEAFQYEGNLTVTMNGNVAEVTVVQPERQISRGGTLWAKVGPYILLFSAETELLFQDYSGLAGVRVKTILPSGQEIAQALLHRDTLNGLTWQRALNIAGRARRDGTRRPTLLEELVRWGENHTEYDYNPRYTQP
jgi:hypothetical protein